MAGTKKVVAKKATVTSKEKVVKSEKKNASVFADYFRFGESYTSLILGIIVVIIASLLIVNLLRTRTNDVSIQKDTSSISTTNTEVKDQDLSALDGEGQKTYTVKPGDDLWKIAESQYQNGYSWVEIAKANNISNPSVITVGSKIVIPNVKKNDNAVVAMKAEPTVTAIPTKMPTPTMQATPTSASSPTGVKPSAKPTATPEPTKVVQQTEKVQVATDEKIPGNNYKVASGDYLWEIAERAYGDGYKWVEIARTNKLANPDLIYPGTVLSLPR